MFKELGAILIFVGLIFTFNCWRVGNFNSFLSQLLFGPVLIGLGLQLIK